MMVTMMDELVLLRKYIAHVRQAEGDDFIDKIGEPLYSDVEFTAEEKAVLVRLKRLV